MIKIKNKKGQVWISAVLYILIAAVAMFLILQMGVPLLNQMRDRSSYTRARDVMSGVDRNIQEVAIEGEGSQRVIPIEIRQGEIVLENDTLKWTLETESRIVEPRTSVEFGNVKIYTNIDVNTRETANSFVLENTRIRAYILKFNVTSSISTSQLIQNITSFGETETTIQGGFTFNVGGQTSGTGYTEMIPAGNNTNIDKASVVYHMTSGGNKYDLILTLESESDFLKAEVKNY